MTVPRNVIDADMDPKRRSLLGGAIALPLTSALFQSTTARANHSEQVPQTRSFGPLRFARNGTVNLNAASKHPISLGALDAVHAYFANRASLPGTEDYRLAANRPIDHFAELVNADADEITYVQSTTTGEQMILRGLGLPEAGGHVITDTLHFFGSLPMYRELQKQGVEVTFVRERDGRIEAEHIASAIRPDTRLISLSLVSTVNGFTHDLEAVCRSAHERDVPVYADIIHAAGAIPLDLHASSVDFAACASYKWLMGDFGLGFIYARRDAIDRLRRRNYGYYGISEFESHIYPHDPAGDAVVDHAYAGDARGHFALGTRQQAVIAQLDYSLEKLAAIGVERVQDHAQELVRPLRRELCGMGFSVYTPEESRAPMITCVMKDARKKLGPFLEEESIDLSVSRHRFRVSVSVHNNGDDIERLLRVMRDRVAKKSAG